MNQDIYLSIIVFTVMQGLIHARDNHKSEEVRNFALGLIEKVDYETANWKKSTN